MLIRLSIELELTLLQSLQFNTDIKPKELSIKDSAIWGRVQKDILKPSECRHMEEGGWPNRHRTFIVAEKA